MQMASQRTRTCRDKTIGRQILDKEISTDANEDNPVQIYITESTFTEGIEINTNCHMAGNTKGNITSATVPKQISNAKVVSLAQNHMVKYQKAKLWKNRGELAGNISEVIVSYR